MGSALRGFPDPTKAVARFNRWLPSPDCSDFDAARTAVQRGRKKAARWTERARWARIYVHELEIEALGAAGKKKPFASNDPSRAARGSCWGCSPGKKKPFALNDPWRPYLPRLAPRLAVLVTNGCLAFGTRTGTMTHIAEALAEMVEPAAARDLLHYWVEQREHRSEDIHVAKEEVLAFGDRLIDKAFKGRGVPARIWALADAAVKKVYKNIAAHKAAPPALGTARMHHPPACTVCGHPAFDAKNHGIPAPLAAKMFPSMTYKCGKPGRVRCFNGVGTYWVECQDGHGRGRPA